MKDLAIKIFIDQGHNPGDINAGASGNGLVESEITYNVGIMLAGLLFADPNFEVRVSRRYPDTVLGTDQRTSLQQRVDMANSWPADYFISIHVNSNPNPAINGSEIYVFRENSIAYNMAEIVLDNMVYFTGMRDNQVRVNPSLFVLRRTRMPAMLIELGYLTNLHDVEILRDKQFAFSFGIYIGLLEYFGLPYQL